MVTARYGHTVTLLPNGNLLAVGGYSTNFLYLASAELCDPGTGTWAVTGTPLAIRGQHTATLLMNGQVLIVGGIGAQGAFLTSAELYNPAAGTWTSTGALATGRAYHTATLLADGKVLVVGGESGVGIHTTPLASAELYDPASGTWSSAGTLSFARYEHTATLLPNGEVLIAGAPLSSAARKPPSYTIRSRARGRLPAR